MAVADQCATQNLPFQFHFQSHQRNRMAMTLRPIQILNLKLHLKMILIRNLNHQMSLSRWMNLELD